MDAPTGNYATLAVHLPGEVIAKVDELTTVPGRKKRSRSAVLREIIERELITAPEPSLKFSRRRGKRVAA